MSPFSYKPIECPKEPVVSAVFIKWGTGKIWNKSLSVIQAWFSPLWRPQIDTATVATTDIYGIMVKAKKYGYSSRRVIKSVK